MKQVILPARSLKGELRLPGDRLISLCRAAVAALCDSETELVGYSPHPDCQAMLSALQTLGVGVEQAGDRVRIRGVGLGGLKQPQADIQCGASHTVLGLLCGLLVGQGWDVALAADVEVESMARAIEALQRLGAETSCSDDGGARIQIRAGALRGIRYEAAGHNDVAKLALLLAALYADGYTTLVEEGSAPGHLELALQAAGADLDARQINEPVRRDPDDFEMELKRRISKFEGGVKCPPRREIRLCSTPKLRACKMAVPGDVSLAAFFLAAGAIAPSAEIRIAEVGLNPQRAAFVEALSSMGADVRSGRLREESGEPVGDLVVCSSDLKGIRIAGDSASSMLEEILALVVVGTQAFGETLIRDAAALRKGRIDRLSMLSSYLKQMGARIGELPDGVIIAGGTPLDGIDADSLGDSQVAMALAVAGLVAYGKTAVEHAECVEWSFPRFFDQLARLSSDQRAPSGDGNAVREVAIG